MSTNHMILDQLVYRSLRLESCVCVGVSLQLIFWYTSAMLPWAVDFKRPGWGPSGEAMGCSLGYSLEDQATLSTFLAHGSHCWTLCSVWKLIKAAAGTFTQHEGRSAEELTRSRTHTATAEQRSQEMMCVCVQTSMSGLCKKIFKNTATTPP